MKGRRFLLLALFAAFPLLLSGCFRPAGDSIQPTSGTIIDTAIPPLSGGTVTDSAPAITLLSPGTSSGATATPMLPALTEVTLAPATPTLPAPTSDPLSATLQIITPGFSSIITPDTPIPFATGLATLAGAADATEETVADTQAVLRSGDECTYTVEPGDSLYLIAINNDTTIAGLQEVNPELVGDAPVLQIGQVIKLADCVAGMDAGANITPTEPAPDEPIEPVDTALPEGSQTYQVRPGDTLGAIATRFGVTVAAISRANDLSNPNALSIGQELIIPAPATPES